MVAVIETFAEDPDPTVRVLAAQTLQYTGTSVRVRTAHVPIALLDDTDTEVRGSAMDAIGSLGSLGGPAVPKLLALYSNVS